MKQSRSMIVLTVRPTEPKLTFSLSMNFESSRDPNSTAKKTNRQEPSAIEAIVRNSDLKAVLEWSLRSRSVLLQNLNVTLPHQTPAVLPPVTPSLEVIYSVLLTVLSTSLQLVSMTTTHATTIQIRVLQQ